MVAPIFQHIASAGIEPLVGPLTLHDTTGDVGQYFTGLVPGTDLTLYFTSMKCKHMEKSGAFFEKNATTIRQRHLPTTSRLLSATP